MAAQTTSYTCPACGGPLHFDAEIGKLKCDYCGSTYTTQEIEKLYQEKNQQAAASEQAAEKKAKAEEKSAQEPENGGWGEDAKKMRAYSCTSCGAELICDKSTAATTCPYCGNPTIIPGKFEGALRPDWCVPFKMQKDQAVDALKNYYKGKFLLPGKFASENHLEEIKGVYVPFWLYSGEVKARASYDARQIHTRVQGDYEITTTRVFDVRREGTVRFDRIPVDASTKMPDDLMDSIEPYNYKELKPFSLSYLPGYLASRYDVSSKKCAARADERAVNTAREELENTVRGYSTVTVESHAETVKRKNTEYAVMPVWMLSTKWKDQNFLFAMNGQSGKMIGDLPVSGGKLGALFVVVSALLFAVTRLLIGDSIEGTEGLLACLGIALVMGGLIAYGFYRSMKPVMKKTSAGAYVKTGAGGQSVKLTEKSDLFLRSFETRTKIEREPEGGKKR